MTDNLADAIASKRDEIAEKSPGLLGSLEFDVIEKPEHYNSHPSGVECIEIARHLSFDVGNAFKYVYRADHKNGRQDIEKARYYLRDALKHHDRVFLPSWCFRVQQLLHKVIQFEADPYRLRFFWAVHNGALILASSAVNDMLE